MSSLLEIEYADFFDEVLKLDPMLPKKTSDECPLRARVFFTTTGETINIFCFAFNIPRGDSFNILSSNILDELENPKFIGFSSIVIIVRDMILLRKILKAIEKNPYLRYKSKLILCARRGGSSELRSIPSIKVDNMIIFDWCICQPSQTDGFLQRHNVLHLTFDQRHKPLQAVLDSLPGGYMVTTSNADIYVYSINPALAIIINNYYFTSPHKIREGSDQDVVRLIRELKIAGIPYMLIEDSNRQELLQILDYIEQKDFHPLKCVLVFLMSHGDSNNVLYTHDGQLDINEDVVHRVQSNRSLANAEKLFVINACRGIIDVEWADEDDLEQIPSTNLAKNQLAPGTVVWYSVPNGVQSLRCRHSGSPFIQSFCRHFRNFDAEADIMSAQRRVDMDLKRINYYCDLEKCSDLVGKNQQQRHNIIQFRQAAKQMWTLIKSISEDFPIRENNDHASARLFYVGGTLNKLKFDKTLLINKYFAPDLELDACTVDEDVRNFADD